MERIVIRHLTGSKAHQIEEFSIKDVKELTLGRDPSSAIQYDLDQDDLVSRNHAKIIRDPMDEMQFIITDLSSKNGTYVNKQRLRTPTPLTPGAIIQLGVGEPEFQFDIEPRPQMVPPPTRMATISSADVRVDVLPPPTHVGDAGTPTPSPSTSAEARKPVGFTTVQRLIVDRLAHSEFKSRKHLVNSLAAVLGIMVLVAGTFIYLHRTTQRDIYIAQKEIQATSQEVQTAQQRQAEIMSPTEIAAKYSPATVHIAVGWKLVSALTGGQVYHRHMPKFDEKGNVVKDQSGNVVKLPAYVRLPNGTIEPWLVTDSDKGLNEPIGGVHSGSGFVVAQNGFILTNRHVAATWLTKISREDLPFPGELWDLSSGKKLGELRKPVGNLDSWIPAKSQQLGGQIIEAKLLEGRYEYLDVTFAKSNLRVPATLVRVSNEHDVAMIKVETPQALTRVELLDTYDETRPGNPITILGYPGISPNPRVATQSQDPFHPLRDVAIVPDPTVTTGVIGKVIRGKENPIGGDAYYTGMDEFQLTANTTGQGNSGGPVFDEHGKVIAIFYAGRSRPGDASVTRAIPIKFGMSLMKVSPILK
jgi:serine protease Do